MAPHLKLGWGVTLGVVPSMTPLSLMVRQPPGSRRALSRSSTDGLNNTTTQQHNAVNSQHNPLATQIKSSETKTDRK